MQIFDVIIFFGLRTIQQKTIKPIYLCSLGAKKLAEGKGGKGGKGGKEKPLLRTKHRRSPQKSIEKEKKENRN